MKLANRESAVSVREIRDVILESLPEHWIEQEGQFNNIKLNDDEYWSRPVFVYQDDVNLRIERGKTLVEDFKEDWTKTYPRDNHNSEAWWIFYGSSPVERQTIAVVDGGKARIPLPDRPKEDSESWTMSEYESEFASIINTPSYQFEEKLSEANIEVR